MANFTLLKDPLSGGTVRSSCLLVLFEMIQLKVSQKKGVELRPISASSGTLFFGHRACVLSAASMQIEEI